VSTQTVPPIAECVTSPEFSEDSLALLYTGRHLEDLRFTPELGKYHRLSRTDAGGACWNRDTVCRTFSEIRDLTREQSMLTEKEGRQARLCSAATISAVERLCRFDQRTVMTVDKWDENTMALNTPSGLVDLESGKMSRGKPDDYCTRITAVGPSSKTPALWNECLATWTNGDMALQGYLKRVAGYCLTGSTREHEFFFFHGSGANGKSSFLNTLHGIMGKYADVAPSEVFTLSKFEKHPTSLAGLVGCRLALATETENGSRWAETQLKSIVDDCPIKTRFMRQDFFEFKPQFKLLISGNHKPNLSDVGESMRRRINLLPFTVTVPKENRDTRLKEKLRGEWPAILGWAIEGCREWLRDGLQTPASVKAATDDYLDSQDVLGSWIEECCILGVNCRTRSKDIHQSWVAWCKQNEQYPTSLSYFLNSLLERPKIRKVHTEVGNLIEGIDVRPA
jgi:putative DNA primase/helicase